MPEPPEGRTEPRVQPQKNKWNELNWNGTNRKRNRKRTHIRMGVGGQYTRSIFGLFIWRQKRSTPALSHFSPNKITMAHPTQGWLPRTCIPPSHVAPDPDSVQHTEPPHRLLPPLAALAPCPLSFSLLFDVNLISVFTFWGFHSHMPAMGTVHWKKNLNILPIDFYKINILKKLYFIF